MIVMIAEQQILDPQKVCQNCLMSDKSGLPRWHNSQLGCGTMQPQQTSKEAKVYRCQMGFNVAWIN